LTNKTLDSTTYLSDATTPTKRANFDLSNITAGTTRTLTIPNISGTIAASASGVIQLDSNTGTISCPTCITTGGTNFVTSVNSLTGAVNIVGAGINTVTTNGQTITVTGTEADTLQSVTARGQSSDQALILSNASPLTFSNTTNPTVITLGTGDSAGVLSIKDSNTSHNTLMTLTDSGTYGTLGVNTISASYIG
jgi:hypothetical protein